MYVGISGFGWSLIIYQKIEQIDSLKCYQSTVKISKRSTIYFMYKNYFIQAFLYGNSPTRERQ